MSFNEQDRQPKKTPVLRINITILALVSKTFRSTDSPLQAKCRSRCRADDTCANYKFDGDCVRPAGGEPSSMQ